MENETAIIWCSGQATLPSAEPILFKFQAVVKYETEIKRRGSVIGL